MNKRLKKKRIYGTKLSENKLRTILLLNKHINMYVKLPLCPKRESEVKEWKNINIPQKLEMLL